MVKRLLPHNGVTDIPTGPPVDVGADVVGNGLYIVEAKATLCFLYSVGPGQTVLLSNKHPGGTYGASQLVVDQPFGFLGQVDLQYVKPPPHAPAMANEQSTINLLMSWDAKGWDSYSYKNDMLKLWSGPSVVDTLRLQVADPYGITVQKAPGAWAVISANTASLHGVNFVDGYSAAMPVHGG